MFTTFSSSISILGLLQQQLRRCQSARQWAEAGVVHLGVRLTCCHCWQQLVKWIPNKVVSCFPFSLPCPAPPGEAVHLISSDSGHSAKQCASRGACLAGFIKWRGSPSDQQSAVKQSESQTHQLRLKVLCRQLPDSSWGGMWNWVCTQSFRAPYKITRK